MTAPDGGTYLMRCEGCNGEAAWTIVRIGDVLTTWACGACLPGVLADHEREGRKTEFMVAAFVGPRLDLPATAGV